MEQTIPINNTGIAYGDSIIKPLLCPHCRKLPIEITSIICNNNTPSFSYKCPSCSLNESQFSSSIHNYILSIDNISKIAATSRQYYCVNCDVSLENKDEINWHKKYSKNEQHVLLGYEVKMKKTCHNLNSFCNYHCFNCENGVSLCAECVIAHHKMFKDHKCDTLEESWEKVKSNLMYKTYEEYNDNITKTKESIERIAGKYIEAINSIIEQFREYEMKIKCIKENVIEQKLNLFHDFIKLVYDSFYMCKNFKTYNYEIISSMKIVNDYLMKNNTSIKDIYALQEQQIKQIEDILTNNNISNIINDNIDNTITTNNNDIQLHTNDNNISPLSVKEETPTITNENLNLINISPRQEHRFPLSVCSETSTITDINLNIFPPFTNNTNPYQQQQQQQSSPLSLVYQHEISVKPYKNPISAIIELEPNLLAIGGGDWYCKHGTTNTYTNAVHIYDIKSMKSISTLHKHSNFITCFLLLHNGILLSGSSDKTIIAWKYQNKKALKVLEAHTATIRNLKQFDKKTFISFSDNKYFIVWDADKYVSLHQISEKFSIYDAAILHNSNLYIIGLTSGKKYNVYNNKWEIKSSELLVGSGYVTRILGLNDGRVLFGKASGGMEVHSNDFKVKNVINKAHKNFVSSLIESVKHNVVISGSYDMKIKIWNNKTFQLIQEINEHKNSVLSIIELKDGRMVSASGDESICTWVVKKV